MRRTFEKADIIRTIDTIKVIFTATILFKAVEYIFFILLVEQYPFLIALQRHGTSSP